MSLQIDLKDKVVLITGASSGIGKGIALMCAKAGAKIAGCGLDEEAFDLSLDMKKEEAEFMYVQCDVTDDIQLLNFVEASQKRFQVIDIVISNAGRNVFKGVGNCSEADWALNNDLNLRSHWLLAKFTQKYLKITRGVIIIVTSNHAFQTLNSAFPYNVTKTALTGLVRALAIEWGPDIRTVGIAPGFIDTPGNQEWFNLADDPVKKRKAVIDLHPVRRIGTSEEVGAWCVFLASKFSAFASGTTYLLDGGRSAVMQDE